MDTVGKIRYGLLKLHTLVTKVRNYIRNFIIFMCNVLFTNYIKYYEIAG